MGQATSLWKSATRCITSKPADTIQQATIAESSEKDYDRGVFRKRLRRGVSATARRSTVVELSEKDYHVFLNFRGEDTRKTFVEDLYLLLIEAEIKVFKDDPSLPVGEVIERELVAVIENSQIAITIISKDYASSANCLIELAHILRCMETGRLKVIPVFYNVDPSDVRNLRNSFERIQPLIMRYHGTIVESWKEALKRIANISGFVVDDASYPARIVRSIVEEVKTELKSPRKMYLSRRPEEKMDVDHLVGIDEKAREIIKVISEDANDVLIVGIHGVSGIGKTTLARYIYNQILHQFEFCSFIANIEEMLSQEVSVEQLMSAILEQGSSTIFSPNKGMNRIEQFHHNKKVFIVLDDIDSRIEMRILMGMFTYFGSGSKIMLTTRNRGVLMAPGVRQILIYVLPRLDFGQSMKLFCYHAFGRRFPPDGFVAYTKRVVGTIVGLPLLIEVIGSSLFGKEKVEWVRTFEKLRKIPFGDVVQKLRLSYQGLDDNQKQIFLRIACLPNGVDKHSQFPVLEVAHIEALDRLQALSLVKIDNDNKLYMHDLLRDLAWKILQDEGVAESEYRSQSWIKAMLKGRMVVCYCNKLTTFKAEVAETATTQLEERGYFPEVQTERVQTTAITKGKEPMVALEQPSMSQDEFGEFLKMCKLRRGPSEIPLRFRERTANTSVIGRNSMEAETSSSQLRAHLDRQYTIEEKLPDSTQEAISVVDSFIMQIDLPDPADINFTSPSFLQALECLRQLIAFHKIPTESLMAFQSALADFARTPEYLYQIRSAKDTFNNCMQTPTATVDQICNLLHELTVDKDALQHTQREIALLEAKLTSLKAKECELKLKLYDAIPNVSALSDTFDNCMRTPTATVDQICILVHELTMDKDALQHTQGEIALLEAKLTSSKAKECELKSKLYDAIPNVSALSELKRCGDHQLLASPAQFDDITTKEKRIRVNHHRILQQLGKIKM